MKVVIKLPPQGSTASSLTSDALAFISYWRAVTPEYNSIKIEILQDSMILDGEDGLLLSLFNNAMKDIAERLETRLQERIGMIPSHINDRKTISNICKMEGNLSLPEASLAALQNNEWSKTDIKDLSKIMIKITGKKTQNIQIRYGERSEFALPQFFLVERTEASSEFLRGRGGMKINVKASKGWLLLFFMGFACSYAGYWDNVAVLVHAPWPLLLRIHDKEGLASILDNGYGILPAMTRLKVPAYPKSAYHILSSVELLLTAKQSERELIQRMLKSPLPIEVDRIEYRRTTYAHIERFSIDHSIMLSKLNKLSEKTLTWFSRISRKVIYGLRTGRIESEYLNFVERLYSMLTGAGDPIDTIYRANRIILELEINSEISRVKSPEEKARKEAQIRSHYLTITRDILENLGGRLVG